MSDPTKVVAEMVPSIIPEENKLKDDLREAELKETDLTRKRMFKAVSDALGAVRMVLNKYGSIVGEEPDHAIRLKAATEAREILEGDKGKGVSRLPNVVIKLSDGTMIGIGNGSKTDGK